MLEEDRALDAESNNPGQQQARRLVTRDFRVFKP